MEATIALEGVHFVEAMAAGAGPSAGSEIWMLGRRDAGEFWLQDWMTFRKMAGECFTRCCCCCCDCSFFLLRSMVEGGR